MNTRIHSDYSVLDHPDILKMVFYPRKSVSLSDSRGNIYEIMIPVGDDAVIGSRLYCPDGSAPTILFFHGNGETVADYHEIGMAYNDAGINFWAVDYRGYGRSTGTPTCTSMMQDCQGIFEFVRDWRKAHLHLGPLIIMGRSLGSASALEVVQQYKNWTNGLIIESGFAHLLPVLQRLGVDTDLFGLTETEGFQNLGKIARYPKPTLIIHAERDHIIPFAAGQTLYNACPAPNKTLVKIPNANHNNLFLYGKAEYMAAVKNLIDSLTP